ncbi:MAG TPA: sugar phosphate isomerase/epimerase family protein [Mobilitalea sp.]|nr:sugar phosphate isomerase/epimerase family protein [Mobilitalea sp.]
MKLSVSAWCLQEKLFKNEITLLDFINYCHENGVRYVELLDCFLDGDRDIDKINKLLDKLDMEVSAYSIGNDFVLTDRDERKEQVDYMKESMDTALKLGTRLLRVFSGNQKEGISFEEAENLIVECFQEVAPVAEEKGITMVLENHGLLAGKSSQVKGIIDRVGSKALKSNADVGNFILVNENSLEAVKKLKDKIGFIHLKDFKKLDVEEGYVALDGSFYQGIVLGKGDVPIAEIIKYLKEYGYQGYLSIEYEGSGDPAVGTAECIEYTKHALE